MTPRTPSFLYFLECKINEHPFRLPGLYQPLGAIGVGGFGAVIAAENKTTHVPVCIKKLIVTKRLSHLQSMVAELSAMKQFKHHENLLGLDDAFICPYSASLDNIYLVTCKMDTDLYAIINTRQLQPDQIKFIIYQVFRGVLYLHDSKVSHNDLKPANILVNADLTVKVADFGLVLPFPAEPEAKLSYEGSAQPFDLAGTLNYLAPEIVMNSRTSGGEADCWALGLVFAEMLRGRISFYCDDWRELMKEIVFTLGAIREPELFARDEKMVAWIKTRRPCRKVAWDYLLPDVSAEELRLVKGLLTLNPLHRIALKDAIEDPYFAKLYRKKHRLQSNIVIEAELPSSKPAEQQCMLYQRKMFYDISKLHAN